MSEAPKVEKSGEAPLPFNELDEIAWQKWINKHKERDAARRKKLIGIFWLASVLLVVGAVWELTKST